MKSTIQIDNENLIELKLRKKVWKVQYSRKWKVQIENEKTQNENEKKQNENETEWKGKIS